MARYIDADAFVREINERIEAAIKWGVNAIADRDSETKMRAEQAVATFCEASLTARKMPTADVQEVRHGKWLQHPTDRERDYCSVCGKASKRREHQIDMTCSLDDAVEWDVEYEFLFCPYCGARMDL